MNNKFQFISFVTIMLTIYGLMNFYLGRTISHAFNLNTRAKIVMWLAIIIFSSPFIINRFLYGREFVNFPLQFFGYSYLGLLSISLTFFITKDFLRLFIHNQNKNLTIAAITIIVISTAYSMIKSYELKVKTLNVTIPKLSKNLKIVQLTDLHLADLKPISWAEKVVTIVNKENPDLIFITGDLLDGNLCKQGYCDVLKNLKSKYGVYSIAGNHEFYSGLQNFIQASHACNHIMLRNTCEYIDELELNIAGIDDTESKRFLGVTNTVSDAIRNCKKDKPIFFLAHRPEWFAESKGLVDFQFSGHTHRGQIPPLSLLVYFYYKWSYGLYEDGKSKLYVSQGTGGWGPPMRLFTDSEVTVFNFEPDKK